MAEVPPEVEEKTHDPEFALTEKSMPKPGHDVSTARVTGEVDHWVADPVSPKNPPDIVGCAFCTTNVEDVTVTLLSKAPVAVSVTELPAPSHLTYICVLVAPDDTLNEVEVVPPELAEKKHELPDEVKVNERSKPELDVASPSEIAPMDHTPLTRLPLSAPPEAVGWELCTAKPADFTVTPLSPVFVALNVTEPLDDVHMT